jgi:hypothetical protein
VSDGKTKVSGSNPSSRKTKPPLRAVNEESQQSRACGACYFVVTFSSHEAFHRIALEAEFAPFVDEAAGLDDAASGGK